MNRYLVHMETVTEVDAIDEADAKIQVMKKLGTSWNSYKLCSEILDYHFSKITRISPLPKLAKELPKVDLGKKGMYYFDERLGQLRNVNNPHDYINL